MWHVVKNFESNNEGEIVMFYVKVHYAAIVNFYPALFKELPMVLSHRLLTRCRKLAWNLDKSVFTVPVHVQIIIFIEVKHAISKCTRARPDFNDIKLTLAKIFQLIQHKVCDCVAVERFKKFARGDPGVFWVQTLHLSSVVMITSELTKLYRLTQPANLVFILGKITSKKALIRVCLAVKSIVDKLPEQHLSLGLGLQLTWGQAHNFRLH
jgi:hypothetical protein